MSSRPILALALGLCVAPARAEDAGPPVQLTPIAEVRPRAEVRAVLDGSEATALVNQRARLGGTLSAGPRVAVDVVLQDVRVWGEETDTLKDYSAAGVDLAVGDVRWMPVDGTTLTLGRQTIAFEEERLVGAVDWAPQGRHFDAARLSLGKGALSADVVGSVIGDPDAGIWADDAGAAMVRAGWSPRPAVVVDALYVYDADATVDRHRHTAGIYAKGGNDTLSGRVEAYWQGGDAGRSTIAAHLIGLAGTLSPDVALKPRVTLWLDRLSGDADLDDRTVTTFDTLYQTGHKFYGRMDLFYPTPTDPTGRGLHDAAVKLQASPAKDAQVNLDVHAFLAAAGDDGLLGEEADLWWTQTVGRHLRLTLGAAAFAPADGEALSTFGWLEVAARY